MSLDVENYLQFISDLNDNTKFKTFLLIADSADILNPKLKLILGLIWTLITHYSISSPKGDGYDGAPERQTPKRRILGWIQSKVSDRSISNLTTDWNDGIAIGALVNCVVPGEVETINYDSLDYSTIGALFLTVEPV